MKAVECGVQCEEFRMNEAGGVPDSSCYLSCPAPAKLNLFLHVTGRRADGYHLLQTLFRFIDLNDTLHFELRTDGLIRRRNTIEGVQEDQDLCICAARLLQKETGCTLGVNIDLEKNIPMGGGLGGREFGCCDDSDCIEPFVVAGFESRFADVYRVEIGCGCAGIYFR